MMWDKKAEISVWINLHLFSLRFNSRKLSCLCLIFPFFRFLLYVMLGCFAHYFSVFLVRFVGIFLFHEFSPLSLCCNLPFSKAFICSLFFSYVWPDHTSSDIIFQSLRLGSETRYFPVVSMNSTILNGKGKQVRGYGQNRNTNNRSSD